jgi:hypothetical protein
MLCKKCGSEIEYVGEHYDADEGWCSTYICKKCYLDRFKVLMKRWKSHLYKCKREHCDRCGGLSRRSKKG